MLHAQADIFISVLHGANRDSFTRHERCAARRHAPSFLPTRRKSKRFARHEKYGARRLAEIIESFFVPCQYQHWQRQL